MFQYLYIEGYKINILHLQMSTSNNTGCLKDCYWTAASWYFQKITRAMVFYK